MRVAIDTSFLNRGTTGIGVYISNLIPALEAAGVEVVQISNPAWRPPAGGGLGSLRNYAVMQWWSQWALPRRARAARADVLHHPLPAISRTADLPQVVTVHDLAFQRVPDCYRWRYRVWASRAYRTAARSAAAVICSSQTSALDVAALWAVPQSRIVVAPWGPGQRLEPLSASGTVVRQHLLYIGDQEPRKNLPRLLAAYTRYRARATDPVPLVLAGNLRDPSLPGVIVEARPSPERLLELLHCAIALVHPALHEGFGLTLLEAMAAGVPVIASLAPGVAETAGDAALGVNPYDVDAMAEGIARVASDQALRAELSARGRARAAEFSWERSADGHLAGYRLAVAAATSAAS